MIFSKSLSIGLRSPDIDQLKKKKNPFHFLGIFLAFGHQVAIWGEVWEFGALRLDQVMEKEKVGGDLESKLIRFSVCA